VLVSGFKGDGRNATLNHAGDEIRKLMQLLFPLVSVSTTGGKNDRTDK